jgi:hypothetical protein
MVQPTHDDVVIRQNSSSPGVIYSLGTLESPDQCTWRVRDEAFQHALDYAKHAHVRAWFVKSEDDLVLLGTFRRHEVLEFAR